MGLYSSGVAACGVIVPMTDLFGARGQGLLQRVALAPAFQARLDSARRLIDALDFEVDSAVGLPADPLTPMPYSACTKPDGETKTKTTNSEPQLDRPHSLTRHAVQTVLDQHGEGHGPIFVASGAVRLSRLFVPYTRPSARLVQWRDGSCDDVV